MLAVSRAPRRRGGRRVAPCLLLAAACVCVAPLAFARGAAVDAASPSEQQRAQELYDQGVQHFKAGRHGEAAEAFRKSYGVVASPNSHIMYARALRDAGKLNEAYEELALSQNEASELAVRIPKYASTAESAENELVELRKRVAAISITVVGDVPEALVFVGTRQVPRDRWRSVAVAGGAVDVSARLPSGRRAWQSVTAQIGSVTKVELDLRESAPPPAAALGRDAPSDQVGDGEFDRGAKRDHPLRPWAFVAGGVGVAGLATFGIFGAMSRSTYSDLESSCPNGQCPRGSQEDIDRGKNQQTIANIGLAVGVIGLATGVTLFVIDSGQSSAGAPRRIAIGAGPGSVDVRGSF